MNEPMTEPTNWLNECREALIELRDQQALPRKAAGYQRQIDELDAHIASGGWQDISTAPKDGTAVLVAVRYTSCKGGIREYTLVQTTAYWRDWSGDWNLVDAGDYAEDTSVVPTHWKPLGPPPAPPGATHA